MKRILVVTISLFLMPVIVNAETITYEICKNGCEYDEVYSVGLNINQDPNLADKDIIIKVTDSATYDWPVENAIFGSNDNIIKSLSIDFGNSYINNNYDYIYVNFYVDNLSLKNINYIGDNEETFYINSAKKVTISNSKVDAISFLYDTEDEILLNDVLNIDSQSLNNIKVLGLAGNIGIKNMDFSNTVLRIIGGKINIWNSNIFRLMNSLEKNTAETNIYNSKFHSLIYKQLRDDGSEYDDDFDVWRTINDGRKINNITNFDRYIFDVYLIYYHYFSNTTVYFDKEAEIKVNDKLNLVDYLDYFTEDKEISYTIEDETIAKIENKELIGLKPGNTKVEVTTDDGHVIYNINLTVYTVSEKKVSMKAETKLKLNSVFNDLDMSNISDDVWEISNLSVAKIVNGEIISLAKGETDIVATINGVKYIYHLTVSDTLVSKEIKVPITGKNIKLWVVIVTILLLGVIGMCTYILIKKK